MLSKQPNNPVYRYKAKQVGKRSFTNGSSTRQHRNHLTHKHTTKKTKKVTTTTRKLTQSFFFE